MHRSPRLRRADSAERSTTFLLAVLLSLPVGAPAAAGPEPDSDTSQPPARSVGPVTVTATRAERDVLEVPGNVTVIDREEIEQSGARDLPDLLRREAGVFVTNLTTNPTWQSVEARGFNNGGSAGSSMLVLVDGRRVNEADNTTADWALLSLDAVERIEIVRGPASVLYGDNAVGGVIQILTRAAEGAPRLTLRGSTGSYDSGHGSLTVSGREGPVGISLFGRGSTTDGYRDRSSYWEGSFNGKVQVFMGDRVAVGVGGGYYADHRRLPGSLTQAQIDSAGRRAADPAKDEDESKVHSQFLEGWIEASLTEDVSLRIQPYYGWRDDDATITYLLPDTTTTTTAIDIAKNTIGVDLQLTVDRAVGRFPNRLIAGGQFERDHAKRDIVPSPFPFLRTRRHIYAAFLQNELNLTDDLLLSGGVRVDYAKYRLTEIDADRLGRVTTRPDYVVWSPKAAMIYRIFTPLSVYASYARGFRFPNFDEDAPLFGTIPELLPQKSHSFETGIKLQSERVQGTLAFYHMRVKDELILNPVTFGNENFDRVRHRGIELSLRGQLREWLTLYGSYTLADAKIRKMRSNPEFEDERVPITPLHRGTVGVELQLPLWVELNYNANIVGKRALSNDFSHVFEELDTYVTHDLFLAWRPPISDRVELALTGALRNFAEEKYSDFGTASSYSPPVFYPAARRSWEIGFSLTVRR